MTLPHLQDARVRLTTVDELQMLTCVGRSLWGSKSARFKEWRPGDCLVIVVDKAFAALGRVVGPSFQSNEPVWDNGIFPNRIPVEFGDVILPEHRPPILGHVRDALASSFPAGGYGLAMLNQLLLPPEAAAAVLETFQSAPNDQDYIASNAPQLAEMARALRERKRPSSRLSVSPTPAVGPSVEPLADEDTGTADDTLHSRIQHELIQLGRACGCAVWIASNDRNRLYDGEPLGKNCLSMLPNLGGLSPQASKRIGLIDILWLSRDVPVCAFEVETTTTITSGLLRMSDLLASLPMINMKLFIVAPVSRQARALELLRGPTFERIGLKDFCRVVTAEDLHSLVTKVGDLKGHVQHTVVETIAMAAEDDQQAELD